MKAIWLMLISIVSLLAMTACQNARSPELSKNLAVVAAGGDRDVMLGGRSYLSGGVKSVTPFDKVIWKTLSGPGKVKFETPDSLKSIASFSEVGEYLLTFTVFEGKLKTTDSFKVSVHQPPLEKRLDVVYTKRYKIDSPLWNLRAKALIVNWIPHCIDQINRTDLKTGQGGIDNFIEAAKALNGKPHGTSPGICFFERMGSSDC